MTAIHRVFVAALLAGGLGATTPAQTSGTKPAAEDRSGSQPSHTEFMKHAAADGLAEVELGRLAQQKASRPEVKKFGEKMVKDHGQANEELKQLASQKNVTLPTEPMAEHKAEKEKLSKLSGPAFDEAYVKSMAKDHEKAVDLFQEQASSGSDPDTKAWAAKTLPKLKEHLSEVRDLAKDGQQ